MHPRGAESTMADTKDIELGYEVQDKISGLNGIVTDIGTHITGCTRIGVWPVGDGDDPVARRGDQEWFYGAQLEIVDDDTELVDLGAEAITETTFSLGDRVKDDITGFEGCATTITFDIFNCPQVGVAPVDHTDPTENPDREWFDSVRLEKISGGITADYDEVVNNTVTAETGPTGDDKGSRVNKPQ